MLIHACLANESGEPLGFIAEEPRGFLSTFSRQIFRTHRPFRAIIMDHDGTPILWVLIFLSDMPLFPLKLGNQIDSTAFRLDQLSHACFAPERLARVYSRQGACSRLVRRGATALASLA